VWWNGIQKVGRLRILRRMISSGEWSCEDIFWWLWENAEFSCSQSLGFYSRYYLIISSEFCQLDDGIASGFPYSRHSSDMHVTIREHWDQASISSDVTDSSKDGFRTKSAMRINRSWMGKLVLSLNFLGSNPEHGKLQHFIRVRTRTGLRTKSSGFDESCTSECRVQYMIFRDSSNGAVRPGIVFVTWQSLVMQWYCESYEKAYYVRSHSAMIRNSSIWVTQGVRIFKRSSVDGNVRPCLISM
jgi:hypothetical protein